MPRVGPNDECAFTVRGPRHGYPIIMSPVKPLERRKDPRETHARQPGRRCGDAAGREGQQSAAELRALGGNPGRGAGRNFGT